MKDILIIGGPNGAGKTTMANELLPNKLRLLEFVNADNIALGLSPFNPDGVVVSAGRVMLGRMGELVRAERSFAFETTCAGRGHARFLRHCQSGGWRITLIFLWLDDPNLAIQRVAQRVAAGGHNIPREVIIRRYWAGLQNLISLYLPLADAAHIYDQSDGAGHPIAQKMRGSGLEIEDRPRWARLKGAMNGRPDRS